MQMLPEHDAMLAGWLLPIHEAEPCGGDARHGEAYQLIRSELARLEAVSQPTMAERRAIWERIRAAADEVLRTQSKDIFAAATLARALQVGEGVVGLTLGLKLLGQLALEFGDALYPTRTRARASAYEWLIQQATRDLTELTVETGERELVAALQASFEQFTAGTRALLADSAPSLTPLRTAIARMQLSVAEAATSAVEETSVEPPGATAKAEVSSDAQVVREPTAPPARVASPSPQAPVAASGTSISLAPAAAAPESAAQVASYLGATGSALVAASRLLWREDRASPVSYRLLRTGLWLHLEVPPAHDAQGRTSIPAPDERLYEGLPTMTQHGAWDQLLETAEATLPDARFWLDLHLFTDRALEGLGPAFASARAAAASGLRALLERMPSLGALSFSDGTPLARPETAAWLRQLVASAPVEAPSTHPDHDEALDLDLLRGPLRGPESQQVFAAIEAQRQRCASTRQRFQLDLALARALTPVNQPAAESLFASLDEEIRRHHIEAWEPGLALDLLTAYFACLKQSALKDAAYAASLQTLRARVAKLSPAALVSLAD